MDTEKKFYYQVYPVDRDLSRAWYVLYRVNGKRDKARGNLNRYHTRQEKEEELLRILKDLSRKYGRAINEPYKDRDKSVTGTMAPSHQLKPETIKKLSLIKMLENVFQATKSKLRGKTVSTYQTKIIHFLLWFRESNYTDFCEVREIPKEEISARFFDKSKKNYKERSCLEEYLEYLSTQTGIKFNKNKTRSNKTLNSYVRVLKTYFEYLVNGEVIPHNPLKGTSRLKESSVSAGAFRTDQQQLLSKIIQERHPHLWLACQLSYYCLLRPGEIRKLKVGDINFADQTITVRAEISKNNKTQTVMIPDSFIEQLRFVLKYEESNYLISKFGHPGGELMSVNHLGNLHRSILRELRFNSKYVLYSWKHTGAVSYYKATKDIKGLKEQGRWFSLDMVEIYLSNLGALNIEELKTCFPEIGTICGEKPSKAVA
ncbi:tyrosine-type recombinase/integrase [Chitinophaga rhizosphaerae]|uniref:tyrosine-type recombinase/integrase n=1 Tax=Chitinophaga rhizosphaerae TaxID=1864947 RepID=UPI000F81401C|nr:site-specific integrase [Chitinophaga rhizosphaerae]